jgi:hypothetical protein
MKRQNEQISDEESSAVASSFAKATEDREALVNEESTLHPAIFCASCAFSRQRLCLLSCGHFSMTSPGANDIAKTKLVGMSGTARPVDDRSGGSAERRHLKFYLSLRRSADAPLRQNGVRRCKGRANTCIAEKKPKPGFRPAL